MKALRTFPQFDGVAQIYLKGTVELSRARTTGLAQSFDRTKAIHISCRSGLCGNFSDTSSFKSRKAKGSIGHAFTVCIRTENQNQMSFYPFVLHEISVLVELILGHLRYLLTDVPPQPNSPPDNVFHLDRAEALRSRSRDRVPPPSNGISKTTLKVVVFHFCRSSHLFYTS